MTTPAVQVDVHVTLKVPVPKKKEPVKELRPPLKVPLEKTDAKFSQVFRGPGVPVSPSPQTDTDGGGIYGSTSDVRRKYVSGRHAIVGGRPIRSGTSSSAPTTSSTTGTEDSEHALVGARNIIQDQRTPTFVPIDPSRVYVQQKHAGVGSRKLHDKE